MPQQTCRRRACRTVGVIGLVALVGAALTGCGGDAPHPARSGAVDEATDADTALLTRHGPPPLDAYVWTAEENATIARATERLVARCMQAAGFAYLPPPEGAPQREPVTHWGDYLGLVDLDRAQTLGYQVLDLDVRRAEMAELEELATDGPAADVAYRAALADPGGCSDQAFGTLAEPVGGSDVDLELPGRLYTEARAAAADDAGVRAAATAWRTCMAEAGYDVDGIPLPHSSDPVTAGLVDQAVADVTCKHEVDLVDTYVTALYRAEAALAAQHADELAAFAAVNDERLAIAVEVLED